jgi:hypothetical protein
LDGKEAKTGPQEKEKNEEGPKQDHVVIVDIDIDIMIIHIIHLGLPKWWVKKPCRIIVIYHALKLISANASAAVVLADSISN